KYTNLYRDSESGFDYALSRYYSSSTGRFLSPDKFNIGAIQLPTQAQPKGFFDSSIQNLLETPQALDGFSYVLNNPVTKIDPNGYMSGCSPREPVPACDRFSIIIGDPCCPDLTDPGGGPANPWCVYYCYDLSGRYTHDHSTQLYERCPRMINHCHWCY